ncbi:unnamed protein product [Cylicostephanus goldi]|uniref:Uncharacterized protein n=1 Tax=Cylicostephanus goldi TaxID=71465 RepID=A0A3P7MQW4_CYLGO|nr:unnamed protein product [Cylicostephanus goldi]
MADQEKSASSVERFARAIQPLAFNEFYDAVDARTYGSLNEDLSESKCEEYFRLFGEFQGKAF